MLAASQIGIKTPMLSYAGCVAVKFERGFAVVAACSGTGAAMVDVSAGIFGGIDRRIANYKLSTLHTVGLLDRDWRLKFKESLNIRCGINVKLRCVIEECSDCAFRSIYFYVWRRMNMKGRLPYQHPSIGCKAKWRAQYSIFSTFLSVSRYCTRYTDTGIS